MDHLTAQLAEMQQAAADKQKLEAALSSAEHARADADQRLKAVLKENGNVQRDVSKLKQELTKLEIKQAKSGMAAATEVDTAMLTVSCSEKAKCLPEDHALVQGMGAGHHAAW